MLDVVCNSVRSRGILKRAEAFHNRFVSFKWTQKALRRLDNTSKIRIANYKFSVLKYPPRPKELARVWEKNHAMQM